MSDNNFKAQAIAVCEGQMEFWNKFKNALIETENRTDKELVEMWHKFFGDNNESTIQLIKLKMLAEEIEEG